MKLIDYARKQGISYITTYRWFKDGKMPDNVIATQNPSGMITVEEIEPNYIKSPNVIDKLIIEAAEVMSISSGETISDMLKNEEIRDITMILYDRIKAQYVDTIKEKEPSNEIEELRKEILALKELIINKPTYHGVIVPIEEKIGALLSENDPLKSIAEEAEYNEFVDKMTKAQKEKERKQLIQELTQAMYDTKTADELEEAARMQKAISKAAKENLLKEIAEKKEKFTNKLIKGEKAKNVKGKSAGFVRAQVEDINDLVKVANDMIGKGEDFWYSNLSMLNRVIGKIDDKIEEGQTFDGYEYSKLLAWKSKLEIFEMIRDTEMYMRTLTDDPYKLQLKLESCMRVLSENKNKLSMWNIKSENNIKTYYKELTDILDKHEIRRAEIEKTATAEELRLENNDRFIEENKIMEEAIKRLAASFAQLNQPASVKETKTTPANSFDRVE